MDHVKYRKADPALKLALGMVMYDFDGLVARLAGSGAIKPPDNDEQILEIALVALKLIIRNLAKTKVGQKNKEM